MTDLRKKLETFLYNLDLQIDDIQRIQAGKRIQVFFDTSHVVSAVLGLHDFYGEKGNFKRAQFDSNAALVTSLAASNWLGEIRLLPPHQAEFLRKWQFDFGVNSTRKPESLVKEFLALPGLVCVEIETSAMKVDGCFEVFHVPKTTRRLFDLLNPRVHSFSGCVRHLVCCIGDDAERT